MIYLKRVQHAVDHLRRSYGCVDLPDILNHGPESVRAIAISHAPRLPVGLKLDSVGGALVVRTENVRCGLCESLTFFVERPI